MTMLPSLPTSLNMNRLGKTIEWLKGFKEYEEIMVGGGSSDQISYDDCTPFLSALALSHQFFCLIFAIGSDGRF